jgi:hypothetical protein
VTAVRTGRPIARRTDLYGTWGLRFRGDQGAGFHVVLEGSAWIVPPIVSAPVRLGVGDVVFVGKADGYTLADHPDTRYKTWTRPHRKSSGRSPPRCPVSVQAPCCCVARTRSSRPARIR